LAPGEWTQGVTSVAVFQIRQARLQVYPSASNQAIIFSSDLTPRFMAERMKARVSVHAVDHTPIVTAPDCVVDLILQAVREVRV
jgi:hypothetical protein